MSKSEYNSMKSGWNMGRREFLKISGGAGAVLGALGGGLMLGTPELWARDEKKKRAAHQT